MDIHEHNARLRVTPAIPVLLLWGLFSSWQMGVVYFSTTSMSLIGRLPLPFNTDSFILVIAAGYIASTVFLVFFGRYSLDATRIVGILSLAAIILCFFDGPPELILVAFCVEVFCCVFMIGTTINTIILWFSPRAEFYDVAFTLITSGIFTAFMQSELFDMSFTVFNAVSCFVIVGVLIASFTIKVDRSIVYSTTRQTIRNPKKLTVGILLLIFVSCLMTCFGSTIAETVKNGVSVMYACVAACGVLLLVLYRFKVFNPLEIGSILTVIATVGFVLAVVSNYYHPLRLVACGLIGCGIAVCGMTSLLGVFLFSGGSSRFIAPFITLIGFVTAFIHSTLLRILRGDSFALTLILFSIAAVCVLVFLMILPYLSFLWNSEISEMERRMRPSAPQPIEQQKKSERSLFDGLSGQETRLAELILAGYSGQEIADNMNITVGTMKNYRINLYTKLDIHSRRELFELYGKDVK